MSFRRPNVPSRGFEFLAFGASGLIILLQSAVTLEAMLRGRLPSTDLPGMFVLGPIMAAPTIIIGLLCRWFRFRKLAALREYERVLKSLTEG